MKRIYFPRYLFRTSRPLFSISEKFKWEVVDLTVPMGIYNIDVMYIYKCIYGLKGWG